MRYCNRVLGRTILSGFLMTLGVLGARRAWAQGSPAVTLSPMSLTFSSTPLNQKSPAQSITLTNTGGAALSISSITIGGGNAPKEFTETNTCGTSVAAGANCTISVTFTPFLYGTRTSALAITDNASDSPQNVSLSGTGMGPAVTLSSSNTTCTAQTATCLITFGAQLATTTSAPQTVTLTNSGDAPLTFAASGVTLQGSYAETNTCPANPATLATGSNCTFSITFAPAAGSNTAVPGLIEIMDNASPVPQVISLSGTAQAFTLSSSPTTASVSPGGSANYTISVTPLGGFNAAVSLSCGTLPTGAACSFSPGSVTPDGSSTITSMLTVSTTGSGSAPGGHTRPVAPSSPAFWIAVVFAILGAWFAGAQARRGAGVRRRSALVPAIVLGSLLAAITAVSCGGSSSSSSSSTPTPAGSYTVLVTGSTTAGSGSYTSPVSLTLTVQ